MGHSCRGAAAKTDACMHARDCQGFHVTSHVHTILLCFRPVVCRVQTWRILGGSHHLHNKAHTWHCFVLSCKLFLIQMEHHYVSYLCTLAARPKSSIRYCSLECYIAAFVVLSCHLATTTQWLQRRSQSQGL
jgi:hypothetical protein